MTILKSAKVKLEFDADKLAELKALVETLQERITALDESTKKAISAAKELQKACAAAEAQRRRPLIKGQ